MKINVEHLDSQGRFSNLVIDLNFLQFSKHLAFAGMGAHLSAYNLYRFLGMMTEYAPYWNGASSSFTIPRIVKNDPTDLGQLSNRIGKAMADLLAKRIYGAKFTHNYEDVMVLSGHQLKGKRPDLYCDTTTKQFAVEAKGLSCKSVSRKEMAKHKAQSGEGPISVNFSVASVTYNIYDSMHVKFHDPVGEDAEYSVELNLKLRDAYYRSLLDMLERLRIKPYYQLDGLPPNYVAYQLPELLQEGKHYLLVHELIEKGWWEDLPSNDSPMFINEENVYVDVDGIGFGFSSGQSPEITEQQAPLGGKKRAREIRVRS